MNDSVKAGLLGLAIGTAVNYFKPALVPNLFGKDGTFEETPPADTTTTPTTVV
jgi:hypothetical protein